MKSFVVLSVILFITMFLTKTECSSSDEFRIEYCKEPPKVGGACVAKKCNKENTRSIGLDCALSSCPEGTITKVKEDKTKPYPGCCPHIKCEPQVIVSKTTVEDIPN